MSCQGILDQKIVSRSAGTLKHTLVHILYLDRQRNGQPVSALATAKSIYRENMENELYKMLK